MASDRSYMRSEYQRPGTTALVWLVATIVSAFIIQLVLLSPWMGSSARLVQSLSLTIHGIKDWHLWSLATHSLLHSTGNPFHILFTVLGLIFVGRELEPILGARRFLGLYIGAIILSALCWCLVHWSHGGVHIGAGAGLFAFLVVFAAVSPGAEMGLFFFPVRFRLIHILWVILAAEALALLFYEIPGAAVPLGLSPSTHLGGMLAGWLFFRYIYANNGWDRSSVFRLPGWLQFKRKDRSKVLLQTSSTRKATRSGNLRADVDRILDKINSHGFGALTEEEKQILDDAKDLLSKH